MAKSHQTSPMAELDWAEMEGLFCQQQPAGTPGGNGGPLTPGTKASTGQMANGTPAGVIPANTPDIERRKRETAEVEVVSNFSYSMLTSNYVISVETRSRCWTARGASTSTSF